jgi:uncharacterized protein (TIGR03437 family)
MYYRDRTRRRAVTAGLLIVSLFFAWVVWPAAQMQAQVQRRETNAAANSAAAKKPGLSREKRIREMWVWHEANRQRLARTHELGLQALTTDIINQDTNDISVIQGDGRLITPPTPFDLNGSAVQFTPSGAGYTISSASATYDTNLGTKLNLRTSPAVNPKPQADPGDDAYLIQDLGFSFSFYGTSYSSVAISSNGNLTFRPAGVSQGDFDQSAVSSVESLAEFQGGLPRIAPYWHDLDASATATLGTNGVYLRRDNDRVVISWNNIRDFPNDADVDRGIHRFQVTLFNNGNIAFTYGSVQLTSTALVGISGGLSSTTPSLVDLSSPPANSITAPIAQVFSTLTRVDEIGTLQAFYAAHPGSDVYDFVYVMTDFDFDLGDAFAFYEPIRNSVQGIGDPSGIGSPVFDSDPGGAFLGSQKVQGLLDLSNINTATGLYPESPTRRITTASGANHALSIMGQEQGHRWMSYLDYPGNATLLLGRDDAHWSFWLNTESTISSPAARRASSMEGNVWFDNGNGSFTSVGLNDGYTRLDQYLMGLRPASDVADAFVLTGLSGTGGRTRMDDTEAAVTVNGTKVPVTVAQIIQANNTRTPDSTAAQKNFRAAVVLLVKQGTSPSTSTLNKVTRYRLAWESYFAQSTDFLATMNTGLADSTTPRLIAATSAASFDPTLSPGEIAALFGQGLTNTTAVATTQPLPTTLAGVQVFIDGVAAPLFFAAPTQINFQVPLTTNATTPQFGVSSATALIEVVNNGQLIRAGAFQLGPTAPAAFTANSSGTGAAAAVDAFTGAAAPFNAQQSNGQPNIIALFGTGLGADATDVDGDVKASVQVTIDGAATTDNYAGRAPGFTGLNQLNVTFPANITSGAHTLVVSRNGIPSRQVTIAVK